MVIVSTGADHFVVTREMVQAAMKARRRRSLCLVDLGVPRNVDPGCAQLPEVFGYDVDDLERVVSATQEARRGEALRAEAIVEAEVMAFAREREARAGLPVLAQLRRRAEEIARVEAERTLAHLGAELDERGRRSVEAMAHAIVNKLLHRPTARLKEAAVSGDTSLPGAAAQLFGIEAELAQPEAAAVPAADPAPAPEGSPGDAPRAATGPTSR